jgi:hypothetical protein
MKKRFFVAVSIVALISFFSAFAISAEFWGSKNSDKYHSPTCKWAQKINPSNLVKFSSPEEATKAGYVPCKVCKPPLPSKSGSNVNVNASLARAGNPDGDARRGCCSWHGGVCG